MSKAAPAVSSALGRVIRTELHSLLGVGGAAYGLNVHALTPVVLGVVYAVAVRLLGVASKAVDQAAAKDTAYPGASGLVQYVLTDAGKAIAAVQTPPPVS
ncbi:MAG: hypothetical protein ABSC73_09355 [Acidimicrobiales bacterium]